MLVALDPEDWQAADLEIVTRLAAGLTAKLEGLYVEDATLITAAGLPVTRLVPSGLGERGSVDIGMMSRAMRVRAADARERLAAAAKRWPANWSFSTTRGQVTEQLVARAQGHDLVVMTIARGRPPRRRYLRTTALNVAQQAACSVLLLNQRRQADRSLLAVYEGDERPLVAAVELARIYNAPLSVLAVSGDDAKAMCEAARSWLEARHIRATVRAAGSDDDVLTAVRALQPGLVILDRDDLPGKPEDIDALLSEASLLILR